VQELDIVEFIKHIRLIRFIGKLLLNKTQRPLLKLFNEYYLDPQSVEKGIDVFQEDVDLLCDEGFRPDIDKIDKCIFN